MSEKIEISESVQSQSVWAVVAIVFMLCFFLTVPGCQARSVESYNTCVAKTSDGNKDRCTVGS